MPLAVAVEGANVPDQKLVAETLDAIPIERPEPTAQEPHNLCLDKAYTGKPVDREVRDFGDHQAGDLAGAEALVEAFALLHRRRALEDRDVQALAEVVELVDELADDECRLARVPGGYAVSEWLPQN